MPQITPFLWFDTQAEEAANVYVGLFPNSRITVITRYSEIGPGPVGGVMTVGFELDGQAYTAMNGGPGHPFTDAMSLVVHCADQAEVDRYWDALVADGGQPVACGWLKDRFGLSWQITPDRLLDLIADPDPATVGRAMTAMMQMVKLDIAAIEAAAAG